jgi:non-homologous end joining protein Ku
MKAGKKGSKTKKSFRRIENIYVCENCGERWSEKQFIRAVKMNEDTMVLIQSCGQCPSCWESDY